MGDLATRLARLKSTAGAETSPQDTAPPGSPPERPPLVDRMRRMRVSAGCRRPRITELALAETLGGTLVDDGLIEFSEIVGADTYASSGLAEICAFQGVNTGSGMPIFLDTETTGLSGGTGTLAFLVGTAAFQGTEIQVRQWLLSRFGAEATMLQCVAAACAENSVLVTYNGKSFDAPLLSTRWRLHGIDDPLAGIAHLDLLYLVRRLWRHLWPNCRLATAESRLLGVRREGDLPGSEAPESWFAWLRSGDFDRLAGVLRHNRQDLVSLAHLPVAAARAVRAPVPGEIDLGALAREHERHGRSAAALRLLSEHEDSLCQDAALVLGQLLKRRRRWQDAIRLWARLAGTGVAEAMLELAKYHEHGNLDFDAALTWTHALMGAEGSLRHHQHREHRLLRKRESATRRRGGPGPPNRASLASDLPHQVGNDRESGRSDQASTSEQHERTENETSRTRGSKRDRRVPASR